jgi:hypothetical protein
MEGSALSAELFPATRQGLHERKQDVLTTDKLNS